MRKFGDWQIARRAKYVMFQLAEVAVPRRRNKMPENSLLQEAVGGHDVKMKSDLALERFQAQPKW